MRRINAQYRAGPLLCVAALIVLEATLVAQAHALAAAITNAILLFLLVQVPPRRANAYEMGLSDAARAAVCALALVPLARLVALGLPLRKGSEALATLVVAVLVGLAAWFLAPIVGIIRTPLLSLRIPRAQFLAATAGLVLGFVAYLHGAPTLWPSGATSGRVLLGIVAGVTAAAVSELMFRGVIQLTLQRVAGGLGVLAATALFAATYFAVRSAALVLTVALAGLTFAYVVALTGTLIGSIAGHILLILGAGAIWPSLLGSTHPSWLSEPGSSVGLAIVIAGVTALILRRADAGGGAS